MFVWLIRMGFFFWEKKAFAAGGAISSAALIGVFAAGAAYSDKANDDLHKTVALDSNHKYEQILWRLDSLALGQDKQEKDIEKLDKRLWEIHEKMDSED